MRHDIEHGCLARSTRPNNRREGPLGHVGTDMVKYGLCIGEGRPLGGKEGQREAWLQVYCDSEVPDTDIYRIDGTK